AGRGWPLRKPRAGPDRLGPSRPKTTFDAYDFASVVFDQLMVSERALRGGPISLQEGSVAYAYDDSTAYRKDGYLRPKPWPYYAGVPSGASDHFPLVATFRVCDEQGGGQPWMTRN